MMFHVVIRYEWVPWENVTRLPMTLSQNRNKVYQETHVERFFNKFRTIYNVVALFPGQRLGERLDESAHVSQVILNLQPPLSHPAVKNVGSAKYCLA